MFVAGKKVTDYLVAQYVCVICEIINQIIASFMKEVVLSVIANTYVLNLSCMW